MNTQIRIGLIVCLAAAIIACGGDADKQEEAMEAAASSYGVDADVTVGSDGKTEKVVIKGQGGSTAGTNLDMPPGYPDDIRLPASWNVMSTSPVPGNAGFMVQALSDDSMDDLVAEVRERMTGDGWTETAHDAPTPQMTRLSFEKDDRMSAFNVINNGATHAVQVMTMKKR